jgi:outer membrane protein OmpA-like peptidoglycan-associated protein
MMMKPFFRPASTAALAAVLLCAVSLNAQSTDAAITSTSYVDWTTRIFSSNIYLDMIKSGIILPSGKNSALNRVRTRIPTLVKDPLLSINIDSQYRLGDFVLDEKLTLEELTTLIDKGRRSAGVFDTTGSTLRVDHLMSLTNIGALFIKHKAPYVPPAPVEYTATRAYTGILIDARGTLPVQGEYISAKAEPCLFPKIWDETMEIVYERNMMSPHSALTTGIVHYSYSDNQADYIDRIGADPLRITARRIYGKNLTDPVITRSDALKILSLAENRALLQNGKIVILLDKDEIARVMPAPDKGGDYYSRYNRLKEFALDRIPDTLPHETQRGPQITMQNLNFVPNTATLLRGEEGRLDLIADMLATFLDGEDFTVRVEGHTARVGAVEGELELSIDRAIAIVDALVARGIPRKTFTYRGYGGTMPIAENTTDEGRAKNRRVEILIMPRTTYIQRAWE